MQPQKQSLFTPEQEFIKRLSGYLETPISLHGQRQIERWLKEYRKAAPFVVKEVKEVKTTEIKIVYRAEKYKGLLEDKNAVMESGFIIDSISQYLDIPVEQIKKRIRKREVVDARKICMYFLRRYTNLSLKSIGALFTPTGMDHTSCIHCIEFVKDAIQVDKIMAEKVERLDRFFQNKKSSENIINQETNAYTK